MEYPRLGDAIVIGLGASAATVIVSALLRDILDLSFGLLVVAGVGGWLIGAGVRFGAWAGRPHLGSRLLGVIGAALGALCWLLGLVAAWLLSMAILPGSSRSFGDRLTATPVHGLAQPAAGPSRLRPAAAIGRHRRVRRALGRHPHPGRLSERAGLG